MILVASQVNGKSAETTWPLGDGDSHIRQPLGHPNANYSRNSDQGATNSTVYPDENAPRGFPYVAGKNITFRGTSRETSLGCIVEPQSSSQSLSICADRVLESRARELLFRNAYITSSCTNKSENHDKSYDLEDLRLLAEERETSQAYNKRVESAEWKGKTNGRHTVSLLIPGDPPNFPVCVTAQAAHNDNLQATTKAKNSAFSQGPTVEAINHSQPEMAQNLYQPPSWRQVPSTVLEPQRFLSNAENNVGGADYAAMERKENKDFALDKAVSTEAFCMPRPAWNFTKAVDNNVSSNWFRNGHYAQEQNTPAEEDYVGSVHDINQSTSLSQSQPLLDDPEIFESERIPLIFPTSDSGMLLDPDLIPDIPLSLAGSRYHAGDSESVSYFASPRRREDIPANLGFVNKSGTKIIPNAKSHLAQPIAFGKIESTRLPRKNLFSQTQDDDIPPFVWRPYRLY